ncbi:MAG TPA: hypothetical protein VGN88_12910, partial [Phycisphaerae bacterium]
AGKLLRGIQDLQQLQKQTIAVLESLKSSLDDISQVLRSPEATRGMEKQQNAATLLAKGFAAEAVEQAQGAASLLPANPETHLLLALSLAADEQFDESLVATRKGIALFDRRFHPLAIEAGLLHALASLGCGTEAVERWTHIIDSLPLPVLLTNLGRIASCFPTLANDGGDALLDDLVNRRFARDDESHAQNASLSPSKSTAGARILGGGKIQTRPDEIPAETLFAGLDAAKDFRLPNSHRAILGQIACRLQLVQEPGGTEVLKFLTEVVIPMGNRNLDRTTDALGRAAVRRLYRLHADAMTLHRAMGKLQMAGSAVAVRELSALLGFWRKTGNHVNFARRSLQVSLFLMAGGLGTLIYVLFGMGALGAFAASSSAGPAGSWWWRGPQVAHLPAIWIGPAILLLGALLGVVTLMGRTWDVPMPEGRTPLSAEELKYLNSSAVRHTLRPSTPAHPPTKD